MRDFTYKYLKTFKKLETKLKEIACIGSDVVKLNDILKKAKSKNPIIQFKENIIWDLYGLRNVFAHADREKYIAEVNEMAFNAITELLELLKHPPTVGNVFKTKVYTADIENITEVVIKTMQRELYTHVPIYNGNKFVGILSETTILDWLVENIDRGRAKFYKQKIRDINRKYLHSRTNLYKFVPPELSVFDVLMMFEKAIDSRDRLGVILVTPKGNKNKKPIGIITAWDLPRIKEYLK